MANKDILVVVGAAEVGGRDFGREREESPFGNNDVESLTMKQNLEAFLK